MKILVFSDSHRNISPMETAVAEERPDYIFHLGDMERDAEELRGLFPNIPVASVAGNCDFGMGGERYLFFELRGKKFFLTHGHFYGVKLGLDRLINTALTAGADAALFGHTHSPYFACVQEMMVINPGTVGMGRRTYGVLTLENGTLRYEGKDVS